MALLSSVIMRASGFALADVQADLLKIFDQNNSVGSGDYRKFPNEKKPKKLF